MPSPGRFLQVFKVHANPAGYRFLQIFIEFYIFENVHKKVSFFVNILYIQSNIDKY